MMDINKKAIEDEKKKILLDEKRTELSKLKFINELKNGLGDEILKNPSKLAKGKVVNKKSGNFLTRLFKKMIKTF